MPYMDQTAVYNQLYTGATGTDYMGDNNGTYPFVQSPPAVWLCSSNDGGKQVATWRTTAVWGKTGVSHYAMNGGAQYIAAQNSCSSFSYTGGYLGTGPTDIANTYDGRLVSGPFGLKAWAAAIRDITDGTSNVIAMGEVRPHCSILNGQGPWMCCAGGVGFTTPPINYPTCPGEAGIPNAVSAGSPSGCGSPYSYTTSEGFKSKHTGGAHILLCDGAVRFISENISYDLYQKIGDRRDGSVTGDY